MDKVKEIQVKVEQYLEELENETHNRHMNDLEYGKYLALCYVLDLFDEQ